MLFTRGRIVPLGPIKLYLPESHLLPGGSRNLKLSHGLPSRTIHHLHLQALWLAGTLVSMLLLFFGLAATPPVSTSSRPSSPLLHESDIPAGDVSALPPAGPTVPSPGSLKAQLENEIATDSSQVGVALLDANGDLKIGIDSQQPFVLASVAKVYILTAYLDQLSKQREQPSQDDMDLLEPMIHSSSNDAATELWDKIGGSAGLARFLSQKGLAPVGPPSEEEEWGTISASPWQVATLFSRLEHGQLLDPASTQVALKLLSDIEADQSWGVSAGAEEPGNILYQKNGWYPEANGWRVNSAAAVSTPSSDYVLVIFTYPESTLDDGIGRIEGLAAQVNQFMSR